MKEIFSFLRELEANNNREWFQQNKERYLKVKQVFEDYVGKLIEGIGDFDSEISRLNIHDTLFRIYKDTRFSNDKTPYKTYERSNQKRREK